MKTRFETIEYEISWGKKPRGTGNWAFAQKRNADIEEVVFVYGSYTEAKKQIAKLGWSVAYVLG